MQYSGISVNSAAWKVSWFPIKHSGTPQDFGYILERVQGRLAGWKANLLFFARMLVLTQVVTSIIPNYAMQCSALLAKVLSNVDRLSCNFLWGSFDNKKNLHLVGWSKITKPWKRVDWPFRQPKKRTLHS